MMRQGLEELKRTVGFMSYVGIAIVERSDEFFSTYPYSVPVSLFVSGTMMSGDLIHFLEYTELMTTKGGDSSSVISLPTEIADLMRMKRIREALKTQSLAEILPTLKSDVKEFAGFERKMLEVLKDESSEPKNIFLKDVSIFAGQKALNLPLMNLNIERVEGWMPGKIAEFSL